MGRGDPEFVGQLGQRREPVTLAESAFGDAGTDLGGHDHCTPRCRLGAGLSGLGPPQRRHVDGLSADVATDQHPAGGEKVVAPSLLGQRHVATAGGIQECAVADDHPPGDALRQHRIVATDRRIDLAGVDVAEDTGDDGEGPVTRQLGDGLIERRHCRDERQRIGLRGPLGVVQCDEGVEILVSGPDGDLFGGRGLDHRPGLFDVGQRRPAQLQQQRHIPAHRLQTRAGGRPRRRRDRA